MDVNRTRLLKNTSIATFVGNAISMVCGVGYAIAPAYTPLWDVFGVILVVTLFGDLGLIYAIDRTIDKSSAGGQRLNKLSYIFLTAWTVAMVSIPGANFLLSITYENQGLRVATLYGWLLASYFGLLAFSEWIGVLALKYARNSGPSPTAPREFASPDAHRHLRIAALVVNGILLFLGVYFAILTLAGAELRGGTHATIGMFVAMFGASWSLGMVGNGISLLKITRRYNRKRLAQGLGVATLVTGAILFAPMVTVPASAPAADQSFTAAFGANWRARIPAEVEQYFLPTPFTVPSYFLGVPGKDCMVLPDVSFFNGTSGVDTGVTLYFDAFLPPKGGKGLPGANSTIIRIHGGAWVLGDKGIINAMQVNKYLAAQGYCVFDVQYGLNNASTSSHFSNLPQMELLTPSHVQGNFTVHDMVRHLGLFCKFLAAHHAEYGANLGSVFVSGGSAGGHLTCAVALAIARGNYTDLFGSQLTVRGYIPFYPANGLPRFDRTTAESLIDPTLLVNKASPPCLVYHGTQDGLVHPRISQALKDAYTAAGSDACAVLYLPLGGHSSDLYFSGPYSQVFLYYMERFLYLFR